MKNQKLFSLTCITIHLLLFPFINSSAQTSIEVSGEINQNTVWSDTVKVTGDVTLLDGNSLTIKRGTYIEFQDHYILKIYGDLQANGVEGDSIVFTAKDPATGWKGIRFNNSAWAEGEYPYVMFDNDTSRLNYCRIQYAKSYPAIYMRIFTKLTFEHCLFYRNTSSTSGGNAICALQGGGLISDCHFQENTSVINDEGGALFLAMSDDTHIVRNCTFLNNTNDDGGAIYISGSFAILENNKFINNEASSEGGAIVISNSDDVILRNNLIVNNSASLGGGIFTRGSSITALNNTIANNDASTEGGAIYFEANSDGNYYSNIIWGSEAASSSNQLFIDDDRSDPSFHNCDIQGGSASIALSPGIQLSGIYDNNINADPEFILPSPGEGAGSGSVSHNWSLKSSSPCINKGISDIPGIEIPEYDINHSKRIAFGDIDMGAYEYYLQDMTAGGIIDQDIVWAADTVRITSEVTINNGYTLTILPGVYVEFQDYYGLDVQGRILAKGKEDHPVIFTVKDTAGFASGFSHTGWKGIRFDNTPESNDQSQIDYAILEYGKNTYGGAIYVNNFSKLVFRNTILRSNHSTSHGGAAYCYDAGVTFTGCRIQKNVANNYGGGIYGRNSDIVIRNTSITDNLSTGGGALYGNEGCVISVEHSSLSNNDIFADPSWCRGGAIAAYSFCKFQILNSIIANNTSNGQAGAIFIWSGSILAVNSLIVNNLADSSYTGGVSSVDNADISFYNSIIRGNMDAGSNTQVSNDVKLYYSNIEQNGSFGPSNTNTDPEFILPSEGAGSDYDAMAADWRLSDFSPSINSGTNNIPGIDLPETDMDGFPRVNQNIVDMGVYEHQGDLPGITYQPDNLILCEGNQAVFQVQTSDTVRFQWRKDGFDIPGAIAGQLSIDSISMADQGNYRCIVSNPYDTILSNPAYLFVIQKPKVLQEPDDIWVNASGQASLQAYASGSNLTYQWLKNGTLVPDVNFPNYLFTVSDSTDEGKYSCIISNTCSSDTTSPANVFLAPQICMVTVDPATGKNLIVWVKNSVAPIVNYNIYRESKYAGIYDLIGSVPYDNLSVLADTTADPTVQAYLYRITATDTSGYETDPDLCKTHKTIHLLATKNPETNSTQLDWDRYVGFEYGTYEIFRSDTLIDFSSIHLMSSSTSTWADANPGTGTRYYRVAAVKSDTCYPSGDLKAGTGPYYHSLSNLDDNKLKSTHTHNISKNSRILIYPNPMEYQTMIQFPNPNNENYKLSVIDLSGRIVHFQDNIINDRIEFFRNGLPSGLYLFELRGPEIYRGKMVIK